MYKGKLIIDNIKCIVFLLDFLLSNYGNIMFEFFKINKML